MSNLWTPPSVQAWFADNWGTNPSATPGTSVTPGASDAEGSWTQIHAAIAEEASGIYLRISDGGTAAAAKRHVMDLGIDPAGGSSYTAIINDIVCGASAPITAANASGHQFFFPIRIPGGASVAVRVQGSNGTAGTVRVASKLYGLPSRPELLYIGQYSETLGVSGSSGTSFTPGNAADGTWVSLGSFAKPMSWVQLAYQVDNGTITAEYTYIELGVGDGTNKRIIGRRMHGGNTSEQIGAVLNDNLIYQSCMVSIPTSSTIYVRGRCNNAPDTGYQAAVIGIGG